MITTLLNILSMFRKDARGATAIEYGLIAAGIAVAIAAAVFALGTDLSGLFGDVSEALDGAPAEGGEGDGTN
ncbi:Flp family type IVb pilin [Meridianimarinicoccus sp. RP-17]|uniref:Flp family type IVb pilin n=1 Tax=Meridianimarinicoccus zhengii TaxID=2056810 RepID=UPI000DABDA97|nr:Flp family type IVb pilin [Phycocomes zhengii]